MFYCSFLFCSFCFDDSASSDIYSLSLHDALPICYEFRPIQKNLQHCVCSAGFMHLRICSWGFKEGHFKHGCKCKRGRSEEHTSELQSLTNLVCRLLLEKKK